jgi:S-adenosylmethionine-dependent methyltransferase
MQAIEFRTTLRLIDSYFPPNGDVCDIGGGPGRYSLELARRGYRVSLIDLSQRLLDRARESFGRERLQPAAVLRGDACDLKVFRDAQFDAALMLGPLYHLLVHVARGRALSELLRVLKPGGVAMVAYLNSWGLLRTGVADFPAWYRDLDTVRSLLQPHAYSAERLKSFTESYWSTPPAALAEVRDAGFEVVSYAGAEGFCGGMWPMIKTLAETDPEAFDRVVTLASETAELPQYRDATDHLHIVVRKPA